MAKLLFNNAREIADAIEERGEDVIIELFDHIVTNRPTYNEIGDALRLAFASVIPFKVIVEKLGAEGDSFARKHLPIVSFNAHLTAVELEIDGDVEKAHLGEPDENVGAYFAACEIFAASLIACGEGEGETLEGMTAIISMVPLNKYYDDSIIEKTLCELVRRAFPNDEEELCDECSAH